MTYCPIPKRDFLDFGTCFVLSFCEFGHLVRISEMVCEAGKKTHIV